MPGHMDALEALAAFKKIDREVPIIVLSGQGRTTTVVQAMKLGASDFVSKPFDETDLAVPLANALKQRKLSCEVASLREQLQSRSKHNMLFGNSEPMAEVRDALSPGAAADRRHRRYRCWKPAGPRSACWDSVSRPGQTTFARAGS